MGRSESCGVTNPTKRIKWSTMATLLNSLYFKKGKHDFFHFPNTPKIPLKKIFLIDFREKEEGEERHQFAVPLYLYIQWLILVCALRRDGTRTLANLATRPGHKPIFLVLVIEQFSTKFYKMSTIP